jgi:hypothetical protein
MIFEANLDYLKHFHTYSNINANKSVTSWSPSVSSSRRRRSEFWLSGNDIDEEGVWEWARTRNTVPEFGWTEEPFDSPEENCLAWTITAERRGSSDGWHPSSCCNNLQYICEL